MANTNHQENLASDSWPPPPTVAPPSAAKSLSGFQRFLIGMGVYLFASAFCFGGFIAANAYTTWLEDKPFHESWTHLTIRSFMIPLALWAAFAISIRIFRRGDRKSVS